MDDAILDKVKAVISKHLHANGVVGEAEWINVLLDLLLSLLGGCGMSAEQQADHLNRGSLLAQLAAIRAVRQSMPAGTYFRNNGPARVAALLAAGKEATADDFAAMSAINIG